MTQAYRVIRDEPVGVCVGFCPAGEEVDVFDLVGDDGGKYVYIRRHRLYIVRLAQVGGPLHPQYPEPDLLIWRTPSEFQAWKQDLEESA